MDLTIEISEDDGGSIILCKIISGGISLEILAEVFIDSDRCVLRGVHIQGPGANTVGPERLRRLARQVKERLGVEELRIEGATRTSGSGPGRRPRPLIFR